MSGRPLKNGVQGSPVQIPPSRLLKEISPARVPLWGSCVSITIRGDRDPLYVHQARSVAQRAATTQLRPKEVTELLGCRGDILQVVVKPDAGGSLDPKELLRHTLR